MAHEKEEAPEDLPTFRWIIAGCTGSGKTHLAKWLLRRLPDDSLSELYIVSATAKPSTWEETTPSRVKTEWDPAWVRRKMKRPGHKLFIIDDFLGLIRRDEPALIYMFTAGRHHGSSVILITQKLNGFAPAIRVNASRVYLCRTLAVKELDVLYEEVATASLRKRSDWYAFVEKETRDHGVLVVDQQAGGHDPFQTVRPKGKLEDHFVEPEYSSDEEDREIVERAAKKKTHLQLKKPLTASNRKWQFVLAEPRPPKKKTRRKGSKGT